MALGSKSIVFSLLLDYKDLIAGTQKVQKKWKQIGNEMTSIGRDLSFAVTAPLALIASNAFETGREFDLMRQKISGLSGEGAKGLDELEQQARQLGATTIFTATEVAALQLSLTRLGVVNEDIKQLTPTILRLSQALDSDLAESGEFVVQTLNKMGNSFEGFTDKTSAAEYIAESFAYAVSNSALTVDGLRSSLNYVGAEADAAGLTFAETVAILGQLANSGYVGSRAGTQLRRVFTELVKDGKDVSKEFFEIIRSGYSFEEALSIVGVRAAGVFTALSETGLSVREFTKAINESETVLTYAAEQMDQSLEASVRKVESAFGELSIVLTDLFMPILKGINTVVANVLRGFAEFNGIVQVLLVSILSLAAILPPVIFLWGALTKALASATIQATLLGRALAISFPYLAVATGVLAAVAGLMGSFKNETEQATNAVEDLKDEINNFIKEGKKLEAIQLALTREEDVRKSLVASKELLKTEQQNLDVLEQRLDAAGRVLAAEGQFAQASSREEYNAIRDLVNVKREEVDQIKASINEYDTLLKFLNDYLTANEKLVKSIEDKNTADRESRLYVGVMINDYKRIQEQIKGLTDTFKEIGGTNEDIKKIEELKKQLEDLKKVLESVGVDIDQYDNPLGVANVQTLIREYNRLSQVIKNISLSDNVNLDEFYKLKDELDRIKGILDDLGRTPEELTPDERTTFADAIQRYIDAEKNFKSILAQEPINVTALTAANEEMSEAANLLQLMGVELASIQGTDAFSEAQARRNKAYAETIDELLQKTQDLSPEVTDTEKLFREMDQSLNDVADTAGFSKQQIIRLSEVLGQYKETYEDLMKTQEENRIAEQLLKDQQAYASALVGTFSSITNSMFDIIDGTKSFGDVIIDTLKRVLAQVVALTAAWIVLNIVSGGGASAINGGLNFGQYLRQGTLGFGAFPDGTRSSTRVTGVVSGSNLVISTERGITAYDRTYG